jgi:hypothetical protein
MLDLNVIVINYNREDYWPYLKSILESYTHITPHIAYCYGGIDLAHQCDFRPTIDRGHIFGGIDQLIGGYNLLKSNSVPNWLVLCADSWPLDESKLINIFSEMSKINASYAGSYWGGGPDYFSTDFLISQNTPQFNFMEQFTTQILPFLSSCDLTKICGPERLASIIAHQSKSFYLLPERNNATIESSRWSVPALGWCEFHTLQQNIIFASNYYSSHPEIPIPDIFLKL